jgi:LacI family transcriptional regulator
VGEHPAARESAGTAGTAVSSAPAGPAAPAATVGPLSRATVSDVARLAGVSGKTVSRVISGQPNVSPQTRRRVLDAAQRLRFRPNHLARDLRRGGASTTAAFVIGDLTNPFYSRVAAGIEKVLAEHGLTMLIAATGDDPSQEAAIVATMLERRVRSLMLVPIAADQSYLEGERQLGTPVVCIDRPGQNLVADSVVFANAEGAASAVRSLLAHGHRRIAYVGGPTSLYTHGRRLAGYRQALREAGVEGSRRWERADSPDTASAEQAVRELLARPEPPTAIFASNNRASLGVLAALRTTDRRVAFIGFDDFDLASALGVSVVGHDPAEMGRQAVWLALARQAQLTAPPSQVVLPTRLVARGSGELPPAES